MAQSAPRHGERVRRVAAGTPQATPMDHPALARESGVNKATSHIENGPERTRPETLVKLATALGTTADDLRQQAAGPGDPQRLTLLTLWEAILPEHRHVLLQEAERIAAASQAISTINRINCNSC